MSEEMLAYYLSHGMMSDPGPYAGALEGLPDDLGSLRDVVQANLVHVFWAERYGLSLGEEQKATLEQRSMIEKLGDLDRRGLLPLSANRTITERQVGNCRDFSLFLSSFLRAKGVPARARCGFGTYFLPNHFEDHWVCEVWDAGRRDWVLVDAQLDAFQAENLKIDFEPLDVPRNRFITAGHAWRMCRTGEADPEHFGIFDMRGWWFIWGNVVRDFLALNKVEILPWDGGWGHLTMRLEDPAPQESSMLAFYDEISDLTISADQRFEELRRVYEGDENWRLPRELQVALS